MKDHILIDAGFLIALAYRQDQYHDTAIGIAKDIVVYNILCPWPITYEILRTKHTKRFDYLQVVRNFITSYKVTLLNDTPYRETCLNDCLRQEMRGRGFSLVDMVLRSIINANPQDIGYLITFNDKDFVDICGQHRIEILPGSSSRS